MLSYLGEASSVTINGQSLTVRAVDSLEVFHVSPRDSGRDAAVTAMVKAGNQATGQPSNSAKIVLTASPAVGGKLTVANAAQTIVAIDPSLDSPNLAAAAQSADKLIFTTQPGVSTGAALSIGLGLALNPHLLSGTEDEVASAIAGIVGSHLHG